MHVHSKKNIRINIAAIILVSLTSTAVLADLPAPTDEAVTAVTPNILDSNSNLKNDEDMPVVVPGFAEQATQIQKGVVIDKDGSPQAKDPTIFFQSVDKLKAIGDKAMIDNQNIVKKSVEKERDILARLSKLLDQINITINAKQTQYFANHGVGLTVGYSPGTAPAYIGKYHYRQDSYTVQLPLCIECWVKSNFALFDARPSVLMEFFQFFDSRKEAENFKHMYLPKHFPTTAAKATDVRLMKVGDVAHLQAGVNVQVGVQKVWQWAKDLAIHPELGYQMNGQFDMFILKAEDNMFHLRLIGQRMHGVFGEFTFGVNGNFAPFAWSPLTNGLVHLLHLDQLWWMLNFRGDTNIYMADYILKLDDPDVAKAYDEIMSELLRFKANVNGDKVVETIFNPLKSNDAVAGELQVDMSGLDAIYQKDLAEPDHSKRRVDRNFSGANLADDKPNFQNKIGIVGLMRDERQLVRRDNSLTSLEMQTDGTELPQYYSFPMWIAVDDFRAAITYVQRHKSQSSNIIYNAEKKGDEFIPTGFDSIGFYYDFTTKRYTNKVHQGVIRHFENMLPTDAFSAFTQFLSNKGLTEIKNGLIPNMRVSARYFISTAGLEAAEKEFENLNDVEKYKKMRQLLIDHLHAIPRTDAEHHRWFSSCADKGEKGDDKIKHLCGEIDEIAKHLVIAVTKGDPAIRQKQMDQLSRNKLFLEVGPGFLMAVIPPEKLTDSAFFEIKFYLPSQTEPLLFSFPTTEIPHREFYETIQDIQNIMNNLQPDMRLPSDTLDNLTHRKTKNAISNGRFDQGGTDPKAASPTEP